MTASITTRAREELPEGDSANPFSYTAEECLALEGLAGQAIPFDVVRYLLEQAARHYLFAKATARTRKFFLDGSTSNINQAQILRDAIALLEWPGAQVLCHIHDPKLARALPRTAETLDKIAQVYENKAVENRARGKIGSNVDIQRDNYFTALLSIWTIFLRRPVTAGYTEDVGPNSDTVHFIAACARPVLGNDKASLDAVRGILRKFQRASQKAKIAGRPAL